MGVTHSKADTLWPQPPSAQTSRTFSQPSSRWMTPNGRILEIIVDI